MNVRCPNEMCNSLLVKQFAGTLNVKCGKCGTVLSITTPGIGLLTNHKIPATK
mgnify:CR=1 FL=1